MKQRPHFDYPIDELLKKRWSTRAFDSKTLTNEQVLTLFEAARWSASCMNEQPWRFIWSLKDGSDKYNKLLECLTPKNLEWVTTAPLVILTVIHKVYAANGKPNDWAAHDLGLAIGNLTTQASAMDIFVHSMAGFDKAKAIELFSIPENYEPMTMIAVGYLGDPAILSEFNQKREAELQSRKPLTDLFL